MSWDDYYRRRAAIKAVLAYAHQHPEAGVPFAAVPLAQQMFKNRHELVLALQYDWSRALWSRIELLSLQSRGPVLADAQDLARQAWDQAAAANPVLRRLLDGVRDELGSAGAREQDLLVTAGLGRHVA